MRLRETLREQSIRDPLTRLVQPALPRRIAGKRTATGRRKNQAVAILFLDLDHFKNSTILSAMMRETWCSSPLPICFATFFRATDICCRYGGEEFAIILPESSAQDAAIRADALRPEVKRLRLQYKKQNWASYAFGRYSCVSGTWFDPGGVTQIADRCLYESKTRGRDVVTVASPQKV